MSESFARATQTLLVGDMHLEVASENGGSIVSLHRGDQILMQGRPGEAHLACFPMVPYCNRIARGHFAFQGRNIALTPNFPSEVNTIHGMGWQAPWQVINKTVDALHLGYDHDAAASAASGWPWTFRATQTFKLTEDELAIHLQVTNTSTQPMPAGLGLHPFFPAPEQTFLTSQFSHTLQVDDHWIPTHQRPLRAKGDPFKGLPVGGQDIDNIFLGRRVAPTLQWHNQPWKLRLTASNSLPHTVIYAPQAGGFVCVEPISHVPNILNASTSIGGLNTAQMCVLGIGESLSGSAGFLTLRNDSA